MAHGRSRKLSKLCNVFFSKCTFLDHKSLHAYNIWNMLIVDSLQTAGNTLPTHNKVPWSLKILSHNLKCPALQEPSRPSWYHSQSWGNCTPRRGSPEIPYHVLQNVVLPYEMSNLSRFLRTGGSTRSRGNTDCTLRCGSLKFI